jgi:hypothetical protein
VIRSLFQVVVTVFILTMGVSAVQALEIPVEDFWDRLRLSQTILNRALARPDFQRDVDIRELQTLWRDVTAVRYADGSVINVDVRWLTADVAANDTDTLAALLERIDTLLASQVAGGQPIYQDASALNPLEDILANERFQYPEITPTAVPFRPTPTPRAAPYNPPPVDPGLFTAISRVILIIGAVFLVVAVLYYIARGLRIQPAEAAPENDTDDDPETSLHARDLAADSVSHRDYRSAIRYLYLSSLLLLDERGLIHYDRTLTNREHLRQISDHPQLLDVLRPVVNIFENVWYGFMPVDEAMYQQFRQYVEQLHQMETR